MDIPQEDRQFLSAAYDVLKTLDSEDRLGIATYLISRICADGGQEIAGDYLSHALVAVDIVNRTNNQKDQQ